MSRRAVYAGTFNPFHNGHRGVIKRAAGLFDELIIGVGENPEKENLCQFPCGVITDSLGNMPNVRVDKFDGLLVDFAKKVRAQFLVRGLRAISDFDYEFV